MAQSYYYPNIEAALVSYGRDLRIGPDQVAARIGLAKSTYYAKLRGKTSWNIGELCRISRLTGASYEYLVEDRQILRTEAPAKAVCPAVG